MPKIRDPQLIMPFSENFEEVWLLWKDYKWASHKFKYKSVFSEQAALEQLVTLSGGDEEKAVKIIKQSMRREWQGLFPLHETTSENGKSASANNQKPSHKEAAVREFMRRNGISEPSGEEAGDEPNLKAV